jgi:hypothetical protein
MERRAGSFCVLVDGDNEAATARDRIPEVGVRDGSVCDDPTVLPEPINKILRDCATIMFWVHEGHDYGE